jgi:hypothetical protein
LLQGLNGVSPNRLVLVEELPNRMADFLVVGNRAAGK